MSLLKGLFDLIVFPGLIFAIPAGWLFLWVERKSIARMQRRIGPPFMQPCFDFVKLMGKAAPARSGLTGRIMQAWPVLAVAAMVGALGLLPVFPRNGGFAGDLVLLVALLELPSVFMVLAGFTSRSLYGEIGSAREAVLSVAYNVVFLMAIVTIAVTQHSLSLAELARPTANPERWLALIAIVVCIPAKLRMNPFSAASAEQEIYAGPLTEYAGPELGLWELSHGLEWVALTGLVASMAIPRSGMWLVDATLFVITSFGLVLLLSVLAAATARLTIDRSVRFYWRWGLGFAVLAVASAALMRIRL